MTIQSRLAAIVDEANAEIEEMERPANDAAALEDEVTRMDHKPDDIPADVWELIQDNGRLATERLNEILASPRFTRLRAGDQAKLIALAQNRAYGQPKTNNAASQASRKKGGAGDVTASELRQLASRATLPEYKRTAVPLDDIEDATILPN